MSGIEIINQDYVLVLEKAEYVINVQSFSVSDYKALSNKPSINNVMLEGNISSADLGLVPASDFSLKEDIANKIVSLSASADDIQYPSAKCVYDNLHLKADNDLSNLSTEGQAVITAKANVDLSNLSTEGQAVIDNKASVDLSNLSTAGKASLADMVMPSYVNAVSKSVNTLHTADKAGLLKIHGFHGGVAADVKLYIDGVEVFIFVENSTSSNWYDNASYLIGKNSTYQLTVTSGSGIIRFIPLKGVA
ncbi:MAG: hypothetical protein PHX18_00180 [Candidatus Gastranaerophilales bacterium]|nr:hypothetical protein [Candidatus Gastranaerophilales bacterium]